MVKRKDPAAVALGRKGGRIGGKVKVPKGTAMLTKAERVQRAKEAAMVRWKDKK